MSLVFPHNPEAAAKHNLTQLLAFGTPERQSIEHITTQVAKEAFDDHSKAQLGYWHQAKRYTATMAAYGAVIGLPVATVVGATYYMLQDHIKAAHGCVGNPMTCIGDVASGIGSSISGLIAGGNDTSSAESTALTVPATVIGTITALGITDYALLKTTGYQPIRAVASWTANMISTAFVYAAYKAGELASGSYDRQEKEAAVVREQAHKMIYSQNKALFDNVADGLAQKALVAIDSPKELLVLKREIDKLQAKVPLFKDAMMQLTLSRAEVADVLDKFNTVMRSIKDAQFSLRKPLTQKDHRYNAEMMALLPDAEFQKKMMSLDTRNLVDDIRAHTYGVGHTIASYVVPAAAAAKTAAVSGALIFGVGAAMSYVTAPDSFKSVYSCVTGAVCDAHFKTAAAGAAVLLPGMYAASRDWGSLRNRYVAASKEAAEIVSNNKKVVADDLSKIYDGIAAYLGSQPKSDEMSELVQKIAAKVPMVDAQIGAMKVLDQPEVVTAKLKVTLNTLMTIER